METAERTEGKPARPREGSVAVEIRRSGPDWAGFATALLAALLVVYLALENGGYDPIPRDQVGVLVWWGVLLGVGVGALPVPGRTRAALAALGLLFGLTVWTALALGWTESAGRTADELARVATYLGVLTLGVSVATRRREAARPLLGGVTIGLGVVCALGALSRLKMGWFPENEIGVFLPGIEIERRLAYPLNYSSAVGVMAGMTLPLLWAATAWPRTIIAQGLAAAALPLAGLALYLATSGSGAAAAALGLLVLFALAPDRLPKLLTLAAGVGGTAILAHAIDSRAALDRGLPTPAAEQQGDEVLLLVLVVCAAVALLQVGLTLGLRAWKRPPWRRISHRHAQAATAVALLVALPVAIAAGFPGEVSERWETFKSREGGGDAGPSSSGTIIDFSGSGRYQFWESAADAGETATLTGIGPGTFEFWWSRNGVYSAFVRDSHSLYMDSLAELGVVGLLLVTGFVLAVLGIGVVRAYRAPPERRLVIAAATAACAAFALGAALDWIWEIAALPVAFMLLAAVAVAGFSRSGRRGRRRKKRRRRNRLLQLGVAVVAFAALYAIWQPLRGATELQQSRVDAAAGDLPAALAHARDAGDAQPYAADPRVQEALILERQGRLGPAAIAARAATRKESTNWRTWLVLSRIQAERDRPAAALTAYAKSRSLNPRLQ